MLISDFIDVLKQEFKDIDFYNGTTDKNNKCVGLYLRSGLKPYLALGGLENTSYNHKRIDMLVHWGQNANECEIQSNKIYDYVQSLKEIYISNKRLIQVEMMDPGPVDIFRDANNVCEMVIRMIVYYEREAKINNG